MIRYECSSIVTWSVCSFVPRIDVLTGGIKVDLRTSHPTCFYHWIISDVRPFSSSQWPTILKSWVRMAIRSIRSATFPNLYLLINASSHAIRSCWMEVQTRAKMFMSVQCFWAASWKVKIIFASWFTKKNSFEKIVLSVDQYPIKFQYRFTLLTILEVPNSDGFVVGGAQQVFSAWMKLQTANPIVMAR